MDLQKIPVGRNAPWDVNVIIENPHGGDPVKYELDKETGAMFVDRFLHTAMYYPGNYGFIPHTLSGDGDPVDALVVGPVPSSQGHTAELQAPKPLSYAVLRLKKKTNAEPPKQRNN